LIQRSSPAKLLDIAKGTGITAEAVRSVLIANRGRVFAFSPDPEKPRRKLWATIPGASPEMAADSAAFVRKELKIPGPTSVVVSFLRTRPKGATMQEIEAAIGNNVRTDSPNRLHAIRSTVTQLIRTEKVISEKPGPGKLTVYRLSTGKNRYIGNDVHRKKK